MKILVVDDLREQRDLAVRLLSEHEVITASGWATAKEKLLNDKFEVVLTDMMMPGEREGLGNYDQVGKPTPYGFNVALFALKCGVPKVAVASNGQGVDGDHHQHPVLWACDALRNFSFFEGRLMFFTDTQCPYMNDKRPEVAGIESPYHLKDWAEVLKQLMEAK